jgi:hypothetical protein
VAGDHQSEPLSESLLAKPAARLASPRFERQSRDADTKFQGDSDGGFENVEAGQFPVGIGLQHLPQRRKRDYLLNIVPTTRPSMRGGPL